MNIITILLLSFLWVSCKPGPLGKQYKSCKEFCNAKNNPLASSIIEGNYRCHVLRMDALREGKQKKYCGFNNQNPEPALCQALKDNAQKECEKLPYDPSQMNQPVSGSTIYKVGQPVIINGKPAVVINGKICTCDKK